MPDCARYFLKLMLLFVCWLAVSGSNAQCTLAIGSYNVNVAYPVQITVSGTAANTYTWQFGDGGNDTVTGIPVTTHQYADTGSYMVCVYGFDSTTLCRDTACQILALDSDTVYPPTRCILLQQGVPQSKDSYVRSDIPNVSFGLAPDLVAETWYYIATGNVQARGLLFFDLGAIPAGSAVNSASLTLYADSTPANSGNGYPGQPTYGQNDGCILQRITAPWVQDEVTWNTQPGTTPVNPVSLPQSTGTAQNYTVDVTAFTQFWIQHPDSNFGMMLSMPASVPYNNLIFCSSSHPDSALRPALQICYQAPANACAASFTYSNKGDSVWFYNQSANAGTVLWRFDDGDSSTNQNPVHIFSQNGIHPTTLQVSDSTGSCQTVTQVNVTGIVDDTLCGLVFYDANRNNIYDGSDYPFANFEVMIDGIAYYTDDSGFYRIPVGGGAHIITAIIPQTGLLEQTYPTAPLNYTIATNNNQYICGLDFALFNAGATGIISPANGGNNLSVYPNPTNSSWQLAVGNNLIGSGIQIFDATGQLVYTGLITAAQTNLSPNLPAGVYIMRVNTPTADYNLRLVKF